VFSTVQTQTQLRCIWKNKCL